LCQSGTQASPGVLTGNATINGVNIWLELYTTGLMQINVQIVFLVITIKYSPVVAVAASVNKKWLKA